MARQPIRLDTRTAIPAMESAEENMVIMRIAGARPQFMQEVVFRQAADVAGHREVFVHTGQHYDETMSRIFFDELGIPRPDVNLRIGSGGHGLQTGRMLEALDDVIAEYSPDVIVVDGDTNSTLAGALAAAKQVVPLVHVEAGLRSFDRRMPEEVNRIVADHLADLLCSPTTTALANLRREGVGERAVVTGDLMYDCFLNFKGAADWSILNRLELREGDYALATVHRAENTDSTQRFSTIISALLALPIPVVLPVHPRSRRKLDALLSARSRPTNLKVIDPTGYLEILALEQGAACILTDSGGVQREAFFARRPSIVLRDTTEWVEQVDCGASCVAGAEEQSICDAFAAMMTKPPTAWPEIYGGGDAARRVMVAIKELLG